MEVISKVERTAVRRSLHRMVRSLVDLSVMSRKQSSVLLRNLRLATPRRNLREAIPRPRAVEKDGVIGVFRNCNHFARQIGPQIATATWMAVATYGTSAIFGPNWADATMHTPADNKAIIRISCGERSNENKMSDGGRGRVSLGVEVWKSSQKWIAERSDVRSIALVRCGGSGILDGFNKLGLNPNSVRSFRSVR